jgi:hypothetical protein
MTGVCHHTVFHTDDGSHKLVCPGCSGTTILQISASLLVWDDRHELLLPAIGWDRVSRALCLGWPWTAILPISASQVVRIIGLPAPSLIIIFKVIPVFRDTCKS